MALEGCDLHALAYLVPHDSHDSQTDSHIKVRVYGMSVLFSGIT